MENGSQEIPTIDLAALRDLDRRASESRSKRASIGSNGSNLESLSDTLAGQSILGKKREEVCDDCGARLVSELKEVGSWLSMWEMPEHTCPAREARLRADKERRAAEHELWLSNPPADRITAVRKSARLPYWTPAGVSRLRSGEVSPDLIQRMTEHRDLWASGKRPERGLWLWGPTDRRKTCSICALVFDIAHRTPRPAVYWTFERMLKHFRLSVGGRDNEYDPEQIERAQVLALDDIATVKLTEKAWEMLFDIIDTAYDGGTDGPSQTLYVTSNEDPGQVMSLLNAAAPPDGGERVVRRLIQLCEVIEL